MENKKISFGFSKVSKKTEIISKTPKTVKKVDLVDCFEGQAIKIKGAVENDATPQPLVIPIQGPSNRILEVLQKAKEKNVKNEVKEEKPDSELSIDELAARELIREAQNRGSVQNESKVFSLPLKEEKFVAEGATESSLADYENVPISDYGMAMLRGMNWKEGMPIGKSGKKTDVPKLPELRPRGLGLGANKLVNDSKNQALNKNGKELQLVKGAPCKIIAGAHRGHYCEVLGFDDENWKVIVKTSLTKEVLSLNEFLVVVVTKEEYGKGSRVINNVKYEQFQEKEETRRERHRSRSRSSDDRSNKKKNKKKKKKHKSQSSDRGSDSDNERRRKKKNKSRHRSSDSDSDRASRRRKKRDRKK